MLARLLKFFRSWPVVLVAVILLAYLIIGFVFFNPILQALLPSISRDQLHGGSLSIQKARFNPFRLTLSLDQVSLNDPQKQNLAKFDHLGLNFELSSLLRGKWHFDDVELVRPEINLLVQKNGLLNWDTVFPPEKTPKKSTNNELPALLVGHIKIKEGTVRYQDQTNVASRQAILAPLNIELDNLSTLPTQHGRYQIAANFPEQEGQLLWNGSLQLSPLASTGKISLRDVHVGKTLEALPIAWTFHVPTGLLTAQADYQMHMDQREQINLVVKQAKAQLIDASLTLPEVAGKQASINQLKVDGVDFNLQKQTVVIKTLVLDGASVFTHRDATGQVNWAHVGVKSTTPEEKEPHQARTISKPWQVSIAQMQFGNVKASYLDETFKETFRANIDEVNAQGSFKGQFDEKAQVNVTLPTLELKHIATYSGDAPSDLEKPTSFFQQAQLSEGTFDLLEQSIFAKKIVFSEGYASAKRDRQGMVNWQRYFLPKPRTTTHATHALASITPPTQSQPVDHDAKTSTANITTLPWKIEVADIGLQQFATDYQDDSFERPLAVKVARLDAQSALKSSFGERTKIQIPFAVNIKAIEARSGDKPILQLAQGQLVGGKFDLEGQSISADKLILSNGWTNTSRDQNGRLNWQQVFAPRKSAMSLPAPSARAMTTKSDDQPWKIDIVRIGLSQIKTQYQDDSFVKPFLADIKQVDVFGKFSGRFGAKTQINVPIEVGVAGVTAFSDRQNIATLKQAKLMNGEYNFEKNQFVAQQVMLNKVRADVVLGKNYVANWAQYFVPRKTAPIIKNAIKPNPKKLSASQAFGLSLKNITINGIDSKISDLSQNKPTVIEVVNSQAGLQNFSLDFRKPQTASLLVNLKSGGQIQATGPIYLDEPRGHFSVNIQKLSASPAANYLNQYVKLTLQQGKVDAKGNLEFATPSPKQKDLLLNYSGLANIEDLLIKEEETGLEFLGWQQLISPKLNFSLGKQSLTANEVVARKFFGKLVIYQDRSINLSKIMREDKTAPTSSNNTSNSAVKSSSQSGTGFKIAVNRLRVQKGRFDFADFSLPLKFNTKMHSLTGVVAGFALDPKAKMKIELDGKVDEYGMARIHGALEPMNVKDFTDVMMNFRNLSMPNFTPYSGKFAGRKIEDGRLTADLEYKIEKGQLLGNNKFVLNELKLGDRIESPGSMDLPLDLAIAILEDSDGVIDIDLPVTGDLNDPDIKYGGIVWKAIVNLLTKIVTSPFRALGKLLGDDAEKFATIDFDPGKSRLLPPEKEKLVKLSQALNKRPNLAVTIIPGINEMQDKKGLQENKVRLLIDTALKLPEEQLREPIDPQNEATQEIITRLYRQLPNDQQQEKPEEANLPTAEKRLAILTRAQSIDSKDIDALGNKRAVSIQKELGSDMASRVKIKGAIQAKDKGQFVATKLELGVK